MEKSPSDIVYPVGTGQVNHLVGSILTLVDASVADPTQRKAMKDLMGQAIWGWWNSNAPMNDYKISYFCKVGDTESGIFDDEYVGYDSRKDNQVSK